MFDNPNEELKKLEQQLLAVEETDDDFNVMYQDLLREYGPEANAPVTKPVQEPKKTTAKSTGNGKNKKPSAKKGKKKKKSNKGLVITLCLECAGIVAVILWWILRIL